MRRVWGSSGYPAPTGGTTRCNASAHGGPLLCDSPLLRCLSGRCQLMQQFRQFGCGAFGGRRGRERSAGRLKFTRGLTLRGFAFVSGRVRCGVDWQCTVARGIQMDGVGALQMQGVAPLVV